MGSYQVCRQSLYAIHGDALHHFVVRGRGNGIASVQMRATQRRLTTATARMAMAIKLAVWLTGLARFFGPKSLPAADAAQSHVPYGAPIHVQHVLYMYVRIALYAYVYGWWTPMV